MDAEGEQKEYHGALFYCKCMPLGSVVAAGSAQTATEGEAEVWEPTWHSLVRHGGRTFLRQLRQLPAILVLPLQGTAWSSEDQCLVVLAQIIVGVRAQGDAFSNTIIRVPMGSAIRSDMRSVVV